MITNFLKFRDGVRFEVRLTNEEIDELFKLYRESKEVKNSLVFCDGEWVEASDEFQATIDEINESMKGCKSWKGGM